jgi:RNA-directed DNA polymerase
VLWEGHTSRGAKGKQCDGSAESKNLSMRRNFNRENRETLSISNDGQQPSLERSANAHGGNAGMHVERESDGCVVPAKSANNAKTNFSAEPMEGRQPANRNIEQATLDRTQNRTPRSRGLYGVREAAEADKTLRFNNLLHHVSVELMRESFYELKRQSAPGVDGMTWHEYEQGLEERLVDLHCRVHRGSYRAQPSKRTWIPKSDGKLRPLGIASLEDKIVQAAVRTVLQAIYERDFLGFSYGSRPGRGAHQALDALSYALLKKRVNWILDADIQGFFDNIDHEWMMKFMEHRIADTRILRLIRKWLKAGVSEDGQWSATTVGTPQGSVISPLLANIYLHYVLDLWIKCWRDQYGKGDVIVIRYVDDIVFGFTERINAERFLKSLHERFAKFGLTLHAEKTRLIEFGRYASERRRERGDGEPETFDFLGFTHRCGTSKTKGWFTVERTTIATRMRRTLAKVKRQLVKMRHVPLGDTGRWLRHVVHGWMNYFAVPGNLRRVRQFVDEVSKLWYRQVQRRSQRSNWTWPRMRRLIRKYLPRPQVIHAYPEVRFLDRLAARAV